jgi:hypothetical protein
MVNSGCVWKVESGANFLSAEDFCVRVRGQNSGNLIFVHVVIVVVGDYDTNDVVVTIHRTSVEPRVNNESLTFAL